MDKFEVRPFTVADLPSLIELDHSYHTDYVWQMDISSVERETEIVFREVKLPRSMRVQYPREHHALADDWRNRTGILVAELDSQVIGYISLMEGIVPLAIWCTDLVVMRRLRRNGYASSLVLAAQTWTLEKGFRRLILEIQSKNYPGIQLAGSLGYEFCGYSDKYYASQDIALFFSKHL
jgi:GNAT superfamily N-acetyltransferase